jgi:hypothetical protein
MDALPRRASATSVQIAFSLFSRCFLVSGERDRMVPLMVQLGAMMLGMVPPWMVPTVMTAESSGLVSLLTTSWSRLTAWQAMATGSIVR